MIKKEKILKLLSIYVKILHITLTIFIVTLVTVVAEDLIITSNGK